MLIYVFARLAPICMLSRCLLTKISALELSWKFIKSALLVGYGEFSVFIETCCTTRIFFLLRITSTDAKHASHTWLLPTVVLVGRQSLYLGVGSTHIHIPRLHSEFVVGRCVRGSPRIMMHARRFIKGEGVGTGGGVEGGDNRTLIMQGESTEREREREREGEREREKEREKEEREESCSCKQKRLGLEEGWSENVLLFFWREMRAKMLSQSPSSIKKVSFFVPKHNLSIFLLSVGFPPSLLPPLELRTTFKNSWYFFFSLFGSTEKKIRWDEARQKKFWQGFP